MTTPAQTIEFTEQMQAVAQALHACRRAQSSGNVSAAAMLEQRLRIIAPPLGHVLESAGVRAAAVPGLVVINRPETQTLAIECISNNTQRRLGLPDIGFHRGLN